MYELVQKLGQYWQYPFVRYALIAGVLIALCSSLLGVILVLKRFSYIGDGLSHIAFGAMAVAAVMNLTNNMPLVLLVTILCAVLLLRGGQNAKIKGDAALAMISVGSLAIGYLIMNLFSTSANISGKPSPMSFSEIAKEIVDGVDLVIDRAWEGRPTGKASSIVKVGVNGEIEIIRP